MEAKFLRRPHERYTVTTVRDSKDSLGASEQSRGLDTCNLPFASEIMYANEASLGANATLTEA